jgi:hypothetical protein
MIPLLALSLWAYPSEPVIRLTGLALQLLGISTVIWGISVTRALFEHMSFSRTIKDWLSRFPLFRSDVVIGMGSNTAMGLSGKGRALTVHGPGENPTIEARLDSIEKNIVLIHDRITETHKEMDEEFHKLTDGFKHEEQTRQAADHAIREKLEATSTGGIYISVIGASWLFAGVVLSTAAREIAALLK